MSPFKRQIKEQLGQVLMQRGVVTAEQLKQALEAQRREGGLLGEILIKMGFTSEEDITQALAIQHDFPYLPLSNYEFDQELIALIPEQIAKKYYVLPIDKMGDILTIVMANPLDSKAVEEVEALSKCKVEVFVATYTEVKKAIEESYRSKTQEDRENQNG